MRLEGKVALITGNGEGLGRVASVLFAREGASIVGCGRRKEVGAETVRQVEEAGGESIFVPGDLRHTDQVQHIVDEAIGHFGRIDILVNNASILFSDAEAGATYEPITATTDDGWNALIDTNLKGVFLMCRAVLPHMIAQGSGNIINVSSNSAVLGYPLVHCYSAAKAGVASLTRSIAATYAGHGIRANSIAAGIFDSPMAAGTITPFVSQVGHLFNPMARLATMEEIANPLLFLASDESSFVHGVDLLVDGGQAIAALPPIDLGEIKAEV